MTVLSVLPTLLVAIVLSAPAAGASHLDLSPTGAHEVVVEEAARNRARAKEVAERLVRSVGLPPGEVVSPGRPTGVDGLLREPTVTPGGRRHVMADRFWVGPSSIRRVLNWLRRHPPAGKAPVSELTGSAGEALEFAAPPGPRGSGDLGGLLFVTVVKRSAGGSAVRADAFETWEFPRSPLQRIPPGSRFLRVSVSPGLGGSHFEGEEPPPPRFISTEDGDLIARLVAIANRQPAFQAVDLPSCGPDGLASQHHLIGFVFKTGREGRTLARLSQETPIGICDSLQLRLAGRGPYSLEGGWNVLRAARGLIRRAN